MWPPSNEGRGNLNTKKEFKLWCYEIILILIQIGKEEWAQREETKAEHSRVSLVVQWLRMCLPRQVTQVRFPLQEDPTYLSAAKPINCWSACAWSLCSRQQEKPPRWEVPTPQLESGLRSLQLRKAHTAMKTQHSQIKIKKKKEILKEKKRGRISQSQLRDVALIPSKSFSKKLSTEVGLPGWLRPQRICLQCMRPGFSLWVGKIPWRREWQPTPMSLPGGSHGQRGLAGYSPKRCQESDTTEWLTYLCTEVAIFLFFLSSIRPLLLSHTQHTPTPAEIGVSNFRLSSHPIRVTVTQAIFIIFSAPVSLFWALSSPAWIYINFLVAPKVCLSPGVFLPVAEVFKT